MTDHIRVPSQVPYTPNWGYSRAIRVGDHIAVSGTSATAADGSVHAPGDPYAQTVFVLDLIEKALEDAGASLADVVRTRAFVTDVGQWQEVGRAHLERFGPHGPASTCIGGAVLLAAGLVVEIEADAILAPQLTP